MVMMSTLFGERMIMFTGLVSDIGLVSTAHRHGLGRRLCLSVPQRVLTRLSLGDSIACAGVCLTVVGYGCSQGDDVVGWIEMDVSDETLRRTTLGSWIEGTKVNLERSLCVGDELGGHIVLGHVDGCSSLLDIIPEEQSVEMNFSIPDGLSDFIVQKGSVTLDGISFTVGCIHENIFSVHVIPHTQRITTLSQISVNDEVNLEVDIFSGYSKAGVSCER